MDMYLTLALKDVSGYYQYSGLTTPQASFKSKQRLHTAAIFHVRFHVNFNKFHVSLSGQKRVTYMLE